MTEFTDPYYYLGDRSQPWDSPATISGLSAQLDEMIQESIQSGNPVTRTVKLTAKIGVPGQILAETVEAVIEADGNTIRIGDDTFIVEQSTEAVVPFVTSSLFAVGALALGSNPPGWLLVTIGVASSVLYSVFLEEDAEQAIEGLANTVDAEFRLVSSTGQVLGGVWYREGLPGPETIILANTIHSLLEKNAEGFPLAQDGMKIQYLYGNNVQSEFKIYDGQKIEDLAQFYGVSVEDFIGSEPGKLAFGIMEI